VTYAASDAPSTSSTLTGYGLEITRRSLPWFEYGFQAWSTGGSTDGRGSYAHVLSRVGGEVRFLPCGIARIEPWIGAELGLAVADDYVAWDQTQTGPHAVWVPRVGYAEALAVGGRARISDMIAMGAQAGLLFLGFSRADRIERDPADAIGTYFLRPADYGRRLWYALTLSAELTVPD
jgi:hypothetical protein